MTRKIIRAVLTIGILIALVWHVGPRAILGELGAANPVFLVAAFAIVLTDSFIRSQNWRRLLWTLETSPSPTGIWRCYLVGGFLGTVLPSTAATDAARGAMATRWFGGPLGVYMASIVSLNALGLVAACTLGLVAALWSLARDTNSAEVFLVLVVSGGGIFGAVVAYIITLKLRTLRPVQPGTSHKMLDRLRDKALHFGGSLLQFRNGADLMKSFALALIGQGCRIMVLWFVSIALGAGISFAQVALYGPLVMLFSLVPASIGGFGGDQAAFVFFFARFGVDASTAFSVSFATSVLYMCLSFLGGLVYLAGRPGGGDAGHPSTSVPHIGA